MAGESIELTVDYDSLVSNMRQEFLRRGFLKPVRPEAFLEEKLNAQMRILAERVSARMTTDWDKLFPGVARSEYELRSRVDEHLAHKKQEVLEQFKRELARKAKIRQVLGFVFRREHFNLLLAFIVSVMLLPFSIYTLFQPSDFALHSGVALFVGTILVDLYLAFRYFRSN